ncbi:MAG: phospholipase D-like domain-containing protein [Candidatus Dormibacteria bacterium]
MRMTGIALITLLLASCAGPASVGSESALPSPPYIASTTAVGPDWVTLMHGGEPTADRIRVLLDQAHTHIELEMYELGRADLVTALLAAHARGVAVTVIIDPTVDVSVAAEQRLRGGGVDVLDYPVRARMIDHVKLLLVDTSVAVMGGINWGSGSFANHDFDVELRGPVVANLERVYARDLVTIGRPAVVPTAIMDPAVVVATTEPAAEIRPLALHVIESAQRMLILDLYVLTDTGIVHAIERTAARGVTVRVLLDPDQRPSDAAESALRAAGVPVRRYRSHGEKLHAKVAVADEHPGAPGQRQLVNRRFPLQPRARHRDAQCARGGLPHRRAGGGRLGRQRIGRPSNLDARHASEIPDH